MIQVARSLLVGSATDARTKFVGVEAMLNVAIDLHWWEKLEEMEYAHVGLIDGPGNEVCDYCAAVLCLKKLMRVYNGVMVYDHDGRRALVISLMYLNLAGGRVRPDPMGWSRWPTWVERCGMVSKSIGRGLPDVSRAHIDAFDKMPWGVLEVL